MGGDATAKGIKFQADVGAYFATYMLASQIPPFLDLDQGEKFTTLQVESPEAVDDILIDTSSKRRCLVNVKTRVSVSSKSNSPWNSIVDQVVRQWIRHKEKYATEHTTDTSHAPRDRIALAVGTYGTARFEKLLNALLKAANGVPSLDSIPNSLTSKDERTFYSTFLTMTKDAVQKHQGERIPDQEIKTILTMVRMKRLDPDDTDIEKLHELLGSAVLQNKTDAPKALTRIQLHCRELATRRGQTTAEYIRSLLMNEGIKLLDEPQYATDIDRLRVATQNEIEKMSDRNQIIVPTNAGPKTISIKRPVAETVLEHSTRTSLLLIGPPGSGKSGIICNVAQTLIELGHPIVVISVNRHPVSTSRQLSQNLYLDHDLSDILNHWHSEKDGVILIDALDATREGSSEPVFRELITNVKEYIDGWHVVASIREFDLKYGVHYRELFRTHDTIHSFQDSQFLAVRHIQIDSLTATELQQIWNESKILFETYFNATEALKELLHSPFNLHLLTETLHSSPRLRPAITVQTELLDIYWDYRVMDSSTHGLRRHLCVCQLTEEMLSQHQFQTQINIDNQFVEDLSLLAKRGVLDVDYKDRRVAFSHDLLFDYAVSKLATGQDQVVNFMKQMTKSPDNALMVATGARMAFQSLWKRNRCNFWDTCIAIASSNVSHFCMIIPTTVVAEMTDDIEDLEPLIEHLIDRRNPKYDTALLLVDQCTRSLEVVHEPHGSGRRDATWIQIAIRLAAVTTGKLIPTFHMLLGTWINKIGSLDDDAQRGIGILSRRYLVYNLDCDNNRFGIELALRGIVRTLGYAPVESLQLMNKLLDASRVREYGHDDLRFIANHLATLAGYGTCASSFIVDVYKTLFSVSLVSPTSPTVHGVESANIRFISDKGQDFRSAKYTALKKYSKFFQELPVPATRALIAILDFDHGRNESRYGPTQEFPVEGTSAIYRPDNSIVKYRHFREDRDPPLQYFEQGLIELVDQNRMDDIDRVLRISYEYNRSAALWATVLRAGKSRLKRLGTRLLGLAGARPVLEGSDCQNDAIDLLCALHGSGESDQKQVIEGIVLSASSHTKSVILMHLGRDAIASKDLQDEYNSLEVDGMLRDNRAAIKSHGIFGLRYDERSWLSDHGVDLGIPRYRELSDLVDRVQNVQISDLEMVDGLLQGHDYWKQIVELYNRIEEDDGVPEALSISCWDGVTTGIQRLVSAVASVDQLVDVEMACQMLFGALTVRISPTDSVDEEAERHFAEVGVYSSLSPRVMATRALLDLICIWGNVDGEVLNKISSLARDMCPVVRDHVLGDLARLYQFQPKLVSELLEMAFVTERNPRVLVSLLRSCRPLLHHRLDWFCSQIIALDDDIAAESEQAEIWDDLSDEVAWLLVQCWLGHYQGLAKERIGTWVSDPVQYEDRICGVLSTLRKAIIHGDVRDASASDARVRREAVQIVEDVTRNLVGLDIIKAPDLEVIRRNPTVFESALRILNRTMLEVYFASGADSDTSDGAGARLDVALANRFLSELDSTLSLMTRVAHPSVCLRLLETLEYLIPVQPRRVFFLMTGAVLRSTGSGGYELDELAAALFVRSVRRYIADYRDTLLGGDDDIRGRLLSSLDYFVGAGWPNARRLAYEVAEVLR